MASNVRNGKDLADAFVAAVKAQGSDVKVPWLVVETTDGMRKAVQLPTIDDAGMASKLGPFGWVKMSGSGRPYITGADIRFDGASGDKAPDAKRAVVVAPGVKAGSVGFTPGVAEPASDSSNPRAKRFRFHLTGAAGLDTLVQVSPGNVNKGGNAGQPRWYVQAIRPVRAIERESKTSKGNVSTITF